VISLCSKKALQLQSEPNPHFLHLPSSLPFSLQITRKKHLSLDAENTLDFREWMVVRRDRFVD
jgi:hypothetical protein